METEIRSFLENVLTDHNRHKNAYFWTPPKKAADRRRREFERSNNFVWNDNEIEIIQELNMSCHNVYYSLSVKKDGQKKDVRLIKKILKEG